MENTKITSWTRGYRRTLLAFLAIILINCTGTEKDPKKIIYVCGDVRDSLTGIALSLVDIELKTCIVFDRTKSSPETIANVVLAKSDSSGHFEMRSPACFYDDRTYLLRLSKKGYVQCQIEGSDPWPYSDECKNLCLLPLDL